MTMCKHLRINEREQPSYIGGVLWGVCVSEELKILDEKAAYSAEDAFRASDQQSQKGSRWEKISAYYPSDCGIYEEPRKESWKGGAPISSRLGESELE